MNSDYEKFASGFTEALAAEMPGVEFKRKNIHKTNETKDGLHIRLPGSESSNEITPVIYINDLYQKFQNGASVESIASDVLRTLYESGSKTPEAFKFDKENAKENLFPCAINKEWNKELLEDAPHKDIEGTDLTIIARYHLGDIGGREASSIVDYENCPLLGMQPEEAVAQALANGKNENYICRGLTDILSDVLRDNGVPEKGIAEMRSQSGDQNFIYVLTNEKKLYGAAALSDPDALKSALKNMGEEKCYVLPSSLHEVLLIPEQAAKNGNPEQLPEMVKTINESNVEKCDRLSDNVYFFDGNSLSLICGKEMGHGPDNMPMAGINPSKNTEAMENANAKAASKEKAEPRGR